MVNWKSRQTSDLLILANGIIILILINLLSSVFFFRLDLTEEKRYSIKDQTKEILKDIDDDVYVEVFLEGELNTGFRRFQKTIKETLDQFRVYSGNKIQYKFTDPSTALSQKAQSEFMKELVSKGIQPTNVIDKKEDGQRIEKLIFPGAVISYGGAEVGVNLLKGNKASNAEEKINQSMEGVEYEIANAIYKLTNESPKKIGLVTGHGEIEGAEGAAFTNAISEVYDVGKIHLLSRDLNLYDILVIARPVTSFTELEKYHLDQFILKHGNVLFLLDKLEASMDSASREDYYAFPYHLNLDDQLFKYGVRINLDLVQDRNAGLYPIVTNQSGTKPQMQLMEWPFFPQVNHYADHVITHNLDAVIMKFASSIDTVRAIGVKKTPLMFTSQYSRTLSAPVHVSIQSLHNDLKPENFTKQFIPLGYLLEGKFSSLFKNRFLPDGTDPKIFKEEGRVGKIIVVSEGDLAKNLVNPRTREPQKLGYDPFTNYTFANQDLLMNMIAYLADENGLIKSRNKEIMIRPLDKEKIVSEKLKWQIVNLVLPLFVIILFGTIRAVIRKRRYADF